LNNCRYPTSPFSGGALLGDRVRMSDIGNEPVFYSKYGNTRKSRGLSKKAIDAADVLDAANYNFIIFETVGVGQSNLILQKLPIRQLLFSFPNPVILSRQ
jgi:LAO/AO transport system kinase